MSLDFLQTLSDTIEGILRATPALEVLKIEADRALEVPAEDMPFLGLWVWHERGSNDAPAGTAPQFATTATIHLALYLQAIEARDCKRALNFFALAIENAILQDAELVSLAKLVGSKQAQIRIDGDDETHTGHVALSYDFAFTEIFEPDLPHDFDLSKLNFILPAAVPPPAPVLSTPAAVLWPVIDLFGLPVVDGAGAVVMAPATAPGWPPLLPGMGGSIVLDGFGNVVVDGSGNVLEA